MENHSRTPAWTGFFLGLLALVCFCLPFLAVNGRALPLFQAYYDNGLDWFACITALLLALALLLCLLGLRGGAEALGLLLFLYHIMAVGAMCSSVGALLLLSHLTAYAWGCLLGCAGLAANRLFSCLDRKFSSLFLAVWTGARP